VQHVDLFYLFYFVIVPEDLEGGINGLDKTQEAADLFFFFFSKVCCQQ
jgi:hypothetical protein